MKWIIDTDPGIDDAAALITAVRGPLDIIGITSVHGNTPLEHTTRNALLLLEMLGAEVPLYRGAERALLEPPRNATSVHGDDGFGNLFLPDPERRPESMHAVDFMLEAASRHPGSLSILALGPLTNLALAIAKDRSFPGKVAEVVLMGGTSEAKGNTTVVGEFNVAADPEAAAIVFGSGIPIRMVPWETTLRCIVGGEHLQQIQESTSPVASTFWRASRVLSRLIKDLLGIDGLLLCDLVAAAIAIDPSVTREEVEVFVGVETCGSIARGLTAVDYSRLSGREPNAKVCLDVDAERVAQMFIDAVTE